MKVFVGLCFLAILAHASADCGCLKCNPQLREVSPRYSPCKVIYRNDNRNLPSIAPYKLQAAIPPPPPVFVPKEYDYQMEYLPYATPYVGSVYEYGLQAAVPPPPPVHIPFKNLRTGVERVVMDAPFNALVCGTSTCHNGVNNKAPLPAPLPVNSYRDGCGCGNSCGCGRRNCGCESNRYKINFFGLDGLDSNLDRSERCDTCGRDSCDCDRCGCDSCSRARNHLLKDREDSVYRGPTFEPVLPSLCSRYAPILIETSLSLNPNKFRRKRNLPGGARKKRDIIDLPMNFMFKFVPNLLRGPIVHAINTMQHNAHSAVVRARANANKQRTQAHLAKSKYKLKQHKGNLRTSQSINKNSKPQTKNSNLNRVHTNVKEDTVHPHNLVLKSRHNKNHHLKSADTDEMITLYVPPEQLTKIAKHLEHRKEGIVPHRFPIPKPTNKPNQYLVEEDEYDSSSTNQWFKHPRLSSKYNIDSNDNDFASATNNFLKDIFNTLSGKSRTPNDHVRSKHQRKNSLEEMRNHLNQKRYSNEDIRDILLGKMERFNESYEREKRSTQNSSYNNDIKSRRKRAVLLDTNQFQLPFFEIEDELLDNYYSRNSDEEVVGLKRRKKNMKRRRHYDDSEMESGEEILGAGHPLHDHPFAVLFRAPLQLLQNFHEIRKNFQPILYSFPKLLHSSRKYMRDLSKNLQTGVLDFASNILGDFDDRTARRHDSFLFPSRQRRSIAEEIPSVRRNDTIVHNRNKRYILKVVDEKEVQEFLEEKLGGYFDDEKEEEENDDEKKEEEAEEERVGKVEPKKGAEKKFIVKKLSPKLILDNNGKPFIEINGNKRPLFFGKNKNKSTLLQKSKQKPTNSEGKDKEKETEEVTKHDEMNDKIDEVIAQAKKKLRDGELLKSVNCDEIPTQTIKEKINQISSYIQDLVSLDCSKYSDLYENLAKLEKIRKSVTEYWKKVMINEKTNDIQCKIKILGNIREMQNEKDETTKKIAEHLKEGDNFIVKKMIKLLVRLQKLQCLIQKIVDHFDNRMKVGSVSDTEKEIKFVDYLSSLSFDSSKSEEEFVSSLKKEKHDSLHKEIQLLENLRLLLQKDDTYVTNEVAKQIWKMKNIEKLQLGAIEEMNAKLEDNMKIRKELKILFDLLNQIEASEEACEKLLLKVGDHNIVGSAFMLKNHRDRLKRPSLAERLENIRKNSNTLLTSRIHRKKT